MAEELRVAIRYKAVNVPGPASDRAQNIAYSFAMSKLLRPFSYNDDFIHLPTDFDGDTTKWIWILCDFNVRDRRLDLDNIRTEFWTVRYSDTRSA